MEHNIASLADLQIFVKAFAKELQGGTVLALQGELGAGKTTLVQMLARELGIKESVTSPTFTIFKNYKLPPAQQKKHKAKELCHIDVYRLGSADDQLGFEEYLGDEDYISVVEWAEKIKNKLPKNTIWIFTI